MNIGEIARRAGVSRSTVSYALSGKRAVSEHTRQRIQAVIDEIGYQPSATAQALAHGQTRTIGLMIPPLHHRLSAEQLEFVGAVADAAADRDYDLLLSPSGDPERVLDRLAGRKRVDGVLVMETILDDKRVGRLLDLGLPFVTIGRTQWSDVHDWVDLDYGGLVASCVQRLHRLGHRDIALINWPQELLDAGYGPARRAQDAFERACAELGITSASHGCADEPEQACSCVDDLLDRDPGITAFVTINERSLSGVFAALARRSLRVPQDVSVTGVVTRHVGTAVSPPLTAADVPSEEMGIKAVDLLLSRLLDRAAPPTSVLLSPGLVDRGSVAAAPRKDTPA